MNTTFDINDITADETADGSTFTVIRNGDKAQAVTVPFTVKSETAKEGVDFKLGASPIAFAAGQDIVTVPVTFLKKPTTKITASVSLVGVEGKTTGTITMRPSTYVEGQAPAPAPAPAPTPAPAPAGDATVTAGAQADPTPAIAAVPTITSVQVNPVKPVKPTAVSKAAEAEFNLWLNKYSKIKGKISPERMLALVSNRLGVCLAIQPPSMTNGQAQMIVDVNMFAGNLAARGAIQSIDKLTTPATPPTPAQVKALAGAPAVKP